MSVAVAGAGSIGVAFSLVFARAGHDVRCWDPVPSSLERAQQDLGRIAQAMCRHGLIEDPEQVLERVELGSDLGRAVAGAVLVQECAPEDLATKQSLFGRLADLTGPDTVLASSSSAITASRIASGCPAGDRVLVGHPGNPPYLLPVVEVVPSPSTQSEVVDRACAVYDAAGLRPIRLAREVEGFVFNRLQGALLREAYCLVRDGVVSVDDLDAVVRLGLGRRWGVVGPFETVDLNTRGGIEVHAGRMGPAYERMGAERGQHDPWTEDLVAEVARQRRAALPLEEWEERVRWRDERLMELLSASAREAVPAPCSR